MKIHKLKKNPNLLNVNKTRCGRFLIPDSNVTDDDSKVTCSQCLLLIKNYPGVNEK